MRIDLLLGLLLGPVHGTGPVDPAVIAKAEALLKSADEKLAASPSLHAVYTEVDSYTGEYRDLRQIGTLDAEKPGSIRLNIVRARRVKASDPWKDSGNTTLAVSDGQKGYAVFFHAYSTQVRPTAASEPPKLSEAPLLAAFFGGPSSPASQLEKANSAGTIASATAEDTMVWYKAGNVDRTVELGKDGLVHRFVVRNDNGTVRTWTLDSVDLEAKPSVTAFKYEPPKDALPYGTVGEAAGIDVGDAAPDFTDPRPNGQAVHLSDYKGKPVLLEFWATWCWPCNQSIPETQRLAREFKKDGVETLLVSIKDNRHGFDAWVAKHPQYRDLTFAYDDPNHGAAYEAFLHPTNPTLYVIGKDGAVIAKFTGYTGPNPEVEKAIQVAIAGH